MVCTGSEGLSVITRFTAAVSAATTAELTAALGVTVCSREEEGSAEGKGQNPKNRK